MSILSPVARAFLVIALLGWVSSACGDRCLASVYAPPSARVALSDAVTGTAICSARDFIVTTSVGNSIAHEDTCEWWLPEWIAPPDAGDSATASELTLMVSGYLPETVVFDVQRNGCGEIQRPPLQQIAVEPE